jgi:hypothetical protein
LLGVLDVVGGPLPLSTASTAFAADGVITSPICRCDPGISCLFTAFHDSFESTNGFHIEMADEQNIQTMELSGDIIYRKITGEK